MPSKYESSKERIYAWRAAHLDRFKEICRESARRWYQRNKEKKNKMDQGKRAYQKEALCFRNIQL